MNSSPLPPNLLRREGRFYHFAKLQLNETLVEQLVQERTAELQDINCRLEETLEELQATQKQVVQWERLRAIGEIR
jgi:hypothetical protein